jgi:hypothetical protein
MRAVAAHARLAKLERARPDQAAAVVRVLELAAAMTPAQLDELRAALTSPRPR